MYLLKRTDRDGKRGRYVALPGRASSYTTDAMFAKTFQTRDDAERERCVDNEIIVEFPRI